MEDNKQALENSENSPTGSQGTEQKNDEAASWRLSTVESMETPIDKLKRMMKGRSFSAEQLGLIHSASALSGSINQKLLQSLQAKAVDNFSESKGASLDFRWTDLKSQITEMKSKENALLKEIANLKEINSESQGKIDEYIQVQDELLKKEELNYLLCRLGKNGKEAVLSSGALRSDFSAPKQCKAFVMSVDLRQSTSLMLKARSPEKFAAFIDGLCNSLFRIVTENMGVFDKFTGDGILAFFPDFYSGADAGYRVLSAACQCHAIFNTWYKESRSGFSSVLKSVGFGIGIDFGEVHMIQAASGLTVVGSPVVYACRLGGAPAGCTFLNQGAVEAVQARCGSVFQFVEDELDIKHEGPMLAYRLLGTGTHFVPEEPEWLSKMDSAQNTGC